ncbi:sporulation membrane protein YtaF [Peribacillus kribbensis]|uniref:sporulation membrane protein YtaF n=1 Tax=Peribacillus kribbensis TaxID=356658 RepID=UPI00040521A9|nr:sporulation membrane protein YtaF [Peribacillus kribbensis]
MVKSLALLWLAFAVSLDSFNVGFTYGLRKIKIPFLSIAIIAGCSAISLYAAMLFGNVFGRIFSPAAAGKLGGAILVCLGIWVVYQAVKKENSLEGHAEEKMLIKFEIKSIGLMIQVLKKPLSADFDRSGSITGVEALILGFALSLDAFGAGIGASILGYSPHILALAVIVMSSCLIWLGSRLGKVLSVKRWVHQLKVMPGIILAIIGICKLF